MTKNIESSIWNQEYRVRNPESKTVLDSGIQEIFACGIQNPGNICGFWNLGLWNAEYKSRNPESHYWLESGIQCLESWIQGMESTIQDCLGFPFKGRCLHINWILKIMVQFCDLRLWLGMDPFNVLCWSGWQGWIWIQKLEIVGPTFSSFNDMPAKPITKKLWLVLPDEIRTISSS